MKVVIIGGVAGGASTAARLRRLDEQAEIVILEKGDFISSGPMFRPYSSLMASSADSAQL